MWDIVYRSLKVEEWSGRRHGISLPREPRDIGAPRFFAQGRWADAARDAESLRMTWGEGLGVGVEVDEYVGYSLPQPEGCGMGDPSMDEVTALNEWRAGCHR